ncbi:YraN family protein [Helicobacter mustelae]|uniref:UPF0102 protein HMU09780 n=1 Tax=Helicobacter mustelae (strain ATCC 43772 / CCUG 25715 / CIP 103759 / LMG 18044 / NCTC 12198 / R85-136P) TaxID=679897 RepID=D3UIB2_HELM1|nr:YraN family protein [Helicobacter mustelae]CBG40235.1 Putative hypothetical protein [Helicobacter mustelae 12198]SQH71734.1 endonuclease like protein [Helicobacter mustelae]STP12863.1 endonuclease like protein [Helicobacter mustelae]
MSREKGLLAEKKAGEYLLERGFEIAEYNFFSRYGEIDIIALRDDVLHFIEVKSGKNFNPIYAITPQKMKKIIKTIEYYKCRNSLDLPFCIDAICIENDEILFLENITL